MATIRELEALFKANAQGMKSAIHGIQREINGLKTNSNNAAGRMGKAFTNFGNGLKTVSKKARDMGRSLTRRITLPAAGAATALAGVAITKGFGRLVGIDTARAKLSGLGHDAGEVDDIMDSALESVKGTSYGLDEAATTAANAVAAGIEPGKDLTKYLSLTGDAAAIAGTSMGEMGSILNRVQTSNKAYNGDLQQLNDRGLPIYTWLAEEAGVTADAIFDMAANGEISSEMLMNAIEKNIGGAAKIMGEKSFTAAVANMWAAVGRLGASFLDAGNKGGGFFSQVKPLMADLTETFDNMGGAAEKAGVKLGEMFASFIEKVKSTKAAYDDLSPSVQGVIKKVGLALSAVAVGIGPVLTGLGLFGGFVGKVSDGLGVLFTKIGKGGGFIATLGRAFTLLTGPVGLTITAITALVSGFVIAYNKSETFRNVVNKIKDAFLNAVSGIKEFLTTNPQVQAFLDGLKSGFNTMKTLVIQAIRAVVTFFSEKIAEMKAFWDSEGQQLLQAFKNVFTGIKAVVSPVLSFLMSAFQKTFPVLKFILTNAFKVMLEVVKSVWGNIKGTINGGLKIIQGLIQTFSGIFTGDFSKMWEGIKNLFKGAIQFIWNFVQLMFWGKLLKGVVGFAKGFSKPLSSMWTSIKDLFSRVINWIVEFVKNSFTKMRDTVSSISSGIQKVIDATWKFILNKIIKPVVRGIFNFVKNRFTAMRDTISTIFNAIRNFISTVWNAILSLFKTIIKAIVDFVKSRFTNLRKNISTIFNAVKQFISTVWNAIYTLFKTIIKSIVDFVTSRFNNLKKNVTNIFSNIRTMAKRVWNGIKDNIVNPIKKGVKLAMDKFNSFKTSVSKLFSTIKKNVSDYVTGMVETIKGMPGRMKSALTKGAKHVKDGMLSVGRKMVDGIASAANGVIAGVNWVLEKLGVDKIDPWDPAKSKSKWLSWYAEGTDSTKGHPEDSPAVVGDGTGSNAGPELVTEPDGKQYLSPDKPTLVNMKKGTHVLSAKNTREYLSRIPHYANGTAWDKLKSGASKTVGAVKKGAKWAGNKTKAGAKKVADWTGNIWDYVKHPGKLLNIALDKMGISMPGGVGALADIAKGAFKTVKKKAVDFIKDQLSFFDDGGFNPFGKPFRRTSGYGNRSNPFGGGTEFHKGIDFAAPIGTKIRSATGGRVKFAGFGKSGSGYGGYGNAVSILNGAYEILYGHMSKVLAKYGQTVNPGDVIGEVGMSGSATGPHVHFEARQADTLNTINPERFLQKNIAGNSVERWRGTVKQALKMNGLSTSRAMVDRVLRQIKTESGGNPHAKQQIIDVNSFNGSGGAMGLMQTIPSTFLAYKFPGHNDIFNGFDNLLAALNYAKHRYGKSLSYLGNGHGYANGGIVNTKQLAWIAEGGWAETIISHDPAKHASQEKIWQRTGDKLGFEQQVKNEKPTEIVQNLTINSAKQLSPSEISRKNRQALRRMAQEWGMS